MSTAATTHRRFTDPLAMAAAVVLVAGGATVIGVVAASQDSSTTPTAPTAPAQGDSYPGPPSRIGLGDFTSPRQGGGHTTPLKGGHTMLGLP